MTAEIPVQFTHSVKLSETAQGVRVDVHVYANDREIALQEALRTYESMKQMLETDDIPIAPMMIKSK
jgi:hypothetical protein